LKKVKNKAGIIITQWKKKACRYRTNKAKGCIQLLPSKSMVGYDQ
jgi:hypothetical protein